MSQNKLRYILNEITNFLTNKKFIYNLIGIALFLSIVLFGVFSWLRYYTHHGQKLELPDYVNQSFTSSLEDAKARTFQIIVNDSVHIVGKEGGIIQNQNPAGGSLVKEKRKIYVTITKYHADKVELSNLDFYGQQYAQIEAQLKRKSISCKVKSYKFDALTQNSVLEVWYHGKRVVHNNKDARGLVIDKGDTLEFVVSSSEGGSGEVPRLVGQSVGTARFILKPEGLKLDIRNKNALGLDSESQAIIAEQFPSEGTVLPRGSAIIVKVRAPE